MIYIEPIKVSWEPGLEIGVNSEQFEAFMAQTYVNIVKRRVDEQKYKSKWKPLSPKYLKYKEERGWSLKTWYATGELMSNLKVKSKNVIGFDNRKRHKESGEKYLDICRKLEYGSVNVPARPLFRLVYWYMRKNVSYFYKRYRQGGGL